MNRPDRREEIKGVRWQQGRLLLTDTTRRWSKEQRDEADDIERCTAFTNFTAADEGRGREYVFQFGSREECRAAVEWHNYALATSNEPAKGREPLCGEASPGATGSAARRPASADF